MSKNYNYMYNKTMQSINKIEITVRILRLSLLMAIIISLFYASWFNLFISSLTIILTFLPSWFEKKYSIVVPLDFEFAINFFFLLFHHHWILVGNFRIRHRSNHGIQHAEERTGCGEGEIRTPGALSRTSLFESDAFNHSSHLS
jgi:hypothetical protein